MNSQHRPSVMRGDHTILLLCVDPSEARPGLGGVDMAFAVHVVDGDIKNMTSLYPGGMMHPTASAPAGVATGRLMMTTHCGDADLEKGAKLAQETVQSNTGIKTDAVVMVTPTAIDAFIAAVGPIEVPGQGTVTGNSLEFLRAEQNTGGMNRSSAVQSIMKPIFKCNQGSHEICHSGASCN